MVLASVLKPLSRRGDRDGGAPPPLGEKEMGIQTVFLIVNVLCTMCQVGTFWFALTEIDGQRKRLRAVDARNVLVNDVILEIMEAMRDGDKKKVEAYTSKLREVLWAE